MRKVVLYELLSLDGVAEEPSDWMTRPDQQLLDNLSRIIRDQDAILLGRNTYDYWAGYWPTAEVQPFADFINNTPKHVFVSTPPSQEWSNSTFIDSPAADYVADLKEQSGGDIGIHGSIRLAQSLLRASLVDDLRLVVSPTIASRGRRLFDEVGALQRFELLNVAQGSEGALFVDYALKR